MKNRFLAFNIILLIAFSTGCNLFDKNSKNAESFEVLDDPPFEALTDSIAKHPGNAALYFERAEMLSQNELHQLAFWDYQKSWKFDQNETTAVSYISNLFVTGKEEAAISLLEECIKKYPDNNEFRRRLSEGYLQSGNTNKALAEYNNILATDSGNFEAWYEKAVLLARLKDTSNAILAMEKAFALQPLQSFGIYLANLYAETKNTKALSLCNELILRDTLGESVDALFVKGIYLSNIDKDDDAMEVFESCIKRDWKFTEAYIEKGIIFYDDDNIDEALKTFALAAKVSNTYADAYFWMGRCFENIGKMEEAKDNYYRALVLDRDFTEAREALQRLK